MPAELSVAKYRPVDGNVHHWALYLRTPYENLIYQVVGRPTEFRYGHREGVSPQASERFVDLVFVSEIDRNNVQEVKEILENFPISNDVGTWSCQDWVIEALQELSSQDLVDEAIFYDVQESLLDSFDQ
ncbi:hypothetical protein FPV67DRAFT_1542040 [Lyophyllum atratum]|nr:hypothetical protein FPV67DRAFT_1542040 [Lyophyllum atratum]